MSSRKIKGRRSKRTFLDPLIYVIVRRQEGD
jgi:hypothetical protein